MDSALSEKKTSSHQSEAEPVRASGSLYTRVLLARIWLPITIVGVVLFYQLTIIPLGGEGWRFWAELLFYGLMGPTATFVTLNWIASEVKKREKAQEQLEQLYDELQDSHALLGAIQHVTEQFAAAPDLEAALSAASSGITRVTGAQGAAVFFGSDSLRITQQHGLSPNLQRDASERSALLEKGEALAKRVEVDRRSYWVLTNSFTLAGRPSGSVHAYYRTEPGSEQRESFNILANEFSATAEAARSRTRDLVTLVEVDRSIRAEGNLERLLTTLLEQMMSRADATLGGVYLADEEHVLRLKVCRGLTTTNAALRLGEGFVGMVAEDREPRITAQLVDSERSGPVLRQAASAVALPLLSEEELLGVVVLAHEEAVHFEDETLPFLNLVAGQVSLGVRNARAYLQSEELAIAEERARIAREIHDGVAQSLAFSALKLDLVSRLTKTDPEKAEQELSDTRSKLREMIKEVRRSIFALRPIELERHGFSETISRYCSDYGQQNDLTVNVDIGHLPQLSAKSEAVLFRIFQEAMHNVAKHSAAREVTIRLGSCPSGQAFVEVKDDGKGFDLEAVTDRITTAGGLGLRQMKERLEARGGQFELETQVLGGTRIFASVPE